MYEPSHFKVEDRESPHGVTRANLHAAVAAAGLLAGLVTDYGFGPRS